MVIGVIAFFLSACAGKFPCSNCVKEKKCAVEVKYDKNSQFDAQKFKNPTAEYRVVPFWSWNETMEPNEVRRQLRLMKKAGWGGSMIHSRTGLLTEYLGEDWFKAIDACIDESVKLGMLVWLYDEDKWPSGFNGGTVLQANPNFACKALFARPVDFKGVIPPTAKPLGKAVNGIQVYEYMAPKGNPWFNGYSYVDTMSKAAMAKFKEDAYDSYYNRYKDVFGNVIVAEFTDEPAQGSRGYGENWTNSATYSLDFIDEFKKLYGYDPVPHLYKLFTDCDGAVQFRLQYYRTTNRLFENNFMKQLGDACASRNIHLTGHCMYENDPYNQQLWSGRIMPYFRHMGLPGIDHLARQIREVYTGKQVQSVCNQYGKKRMLSEIYGVSGGSLSFEDRQWITYQNMVLGVNQLVPHLSLFSQTGQRKRDFPQNINYQQSWWGMNHYIDVPLARACYALAQGKYATDILLLNPQESVSAVWKCDAKDGDAVSSSKETRKRVKEITDNLFEAMDTLLASQLTFDLGDEQLLEEDGFVKGNVIGIGQMSYKLVLLAESDNMRPATFKKLQEFVKAGGVILRTGSAPKWLDGEKSESLDKFMESVPLVKFEDLGNAIEKSLPAMVVSDIESGDNSKLWTHVRNYNDGSRLVMLTNLSRKENYKGTISLRGGFSRVQILDTDSGDISDIYAKNNNGVLELPIELEKAEALFLRVSKEVPVVTSPKVVEIASKSVIDGWKAERLDDNVLLLDYASFSFDKDSKSINGDVPVVEIMNYLNSIKYDGDVRVRYSFNVKDFDVTQKTHLVVEYPENFTVKVNGKEVKYAGLPFWRDFRWSPIDITGMLKDGKNTVELHYKNFKYGDLAVFQPQWRRYGTEIEAVYIIGDFNVVSLDTGLAPKNPAIERTGNKVLKLNMIKKDTLAITNPVQVKKGNVTASGMPFYNGRLSYATTVKIPNLAKNERAFLRLDDLDCPVAEVLVDGKSIGAIKDSPYEIDITDYIKKSGSKVEIVFYATLRNVMDVLHNVEGETISVWPNKYQIMDLNRKDFFNSLKRFADGTWKSRKWNMDYCQVAFGDCGDVSLVIKRNK